MKRLLKRLVRRAEPQPSLVRIMGSSQRATVIVTPPREPEPTGVMPGFRAAPAVAPEATSYRAVPPRTVAPAAAPAAPAPPGKGGAMSTAPSPWPAQLPTSGEDAQSAVPAAAAGSGPAAATPAPSPASRGRRAATAATAWVPDVQGPETPDAARAGRRVAAPRVSLEFSDGRRLTVAGVGVVGRGPRAGAGYRHVLTIEDPGRALSREHFGFGLTPRGLLWVSDLGSANGTLLDDKPLPANVHVPAPPGSVLRFGDHSARVVEH